jgi:hypothetical protein
MADWQTTGRLKVGFAALVGALAVSLVAPAAAEAAAANRDSSSSNDPADRRNDIQAKQKAVPARSGPGPANSAPQRSFSPQQSPGPAQAPRPAQRKDKPPDRDPHKFSPQTRSSSSNSSPGQGPGSNSKPRRDKDQVVDRDPHKFTPRQRPAAPVPYRDNRRARPGVAPAQAAPGRSGAQGSAMQQLQAWVPKKPKPAAKPGAHDLAYRYRIVAGRPRDPAVQALDEDWEIWGITVWDRDSFGGKFTSDIFLGLLDGVTGTVDLVSRIANPAEYDELMDELAKIAAFAQENPVEFAKQMASWDQWQTEPGRALGNTAFGLIPGVGALSKVRTLRKFLEDSHAAKGPDGAGTPSPGTAQQPAPQQPAPGQPAPQQPTPQQPAPGQATSPDAQSGSPAPNAPGQPAYNAPSPGTANHPDGAAEPNTPAVPANPAPRHVDSSDRPATDTINRSPAGQPNRPGQVSDRRSGNQSSRPDWVRQRLDEGNEFNRRREPYYANRGGANEVHVEPRSVRGQYPRVDSYIPGEEIVSRKNTQLANVQDRTAIGYLRELADTYGPGTVVADTPTNRRDLGAEAIGLPMDGDMVLEVPVQNTAVPSAVRAEARRLGIIIRDENGHTY